MGESLRKVKEYVEIAGCVSHSFNKRKNFWFMLKVQYWGFILTAQRAQLILTLPWPEGEHRLPLFLSSTNNSRCHGQNGFLVKCLHYFVTDISERSLTAAGSFSTSWKEQQQFYNITTDTGFSAGFVQGWGEMIYRIFRSFSFIQL